MGGLGVQFALEWKRVGWRATAAASLALLALTSCASDRSSQGRAFQPATPGVLTVATAVLPAPGFWEPTGDGSYRGVEADLADELADRLDLDRVRVVQVPFSELTQGELGGADVAISQLTPTDERDEVADFTSGYLEANPGVLVRSGVAARDTRDLRSLRWVVLETSTLRDAVEDRIRPDAAPTVVDTRAQALAAIDAGEADAMLLDLPVALALAKSDPNAYEVTGQLPGGEQLAVFLPEASSNLDRVDATVRALVADGTVEEITDRWLGAAGEVPLIRVSP